MSTQTSLASTQDSIQQPSLAGMQELTAAQLLAVVGGPEIKNGGTGIETTTSSAG